MKRNENDINQRKVMIRTAVDNPKAGAAMLTAFATRLKKAQGTTETVKILSELLGVSETTVFRDFSN
jgi:hypothetical protein